MGELSHSQFSVTRLSQTRGSLKEQRIAIFMRVAHSLAGKVPALGWRTALVDLAAPELEMTPKHAYNYLGGHPKALRELRKICLPNESPREDPEDGVPHVDSVQLLENTRCQYKKLLRSLPPSARTVERVSQELDNRTLFVVISVFFQNPHLAIELTLESRKKHGIPLGRPAP